MRDVLRRTLGRSLQELSAMDRLQAAWPVACGRAMAARGQVVGFDGGVVRVEADDAIWLGQMMSMRGVLEREMAQIAGVKVGGIHFSLRKMGR